jgi:hypothetical protein
MAGHLLTRPRSSAAYPALNLGVREINRRAESPSEPTALPDPRMCTILLPTRQRRLLSAADRALSGSDEQIDDPLGEKDLGCPRRGRSSSPANCSKEWSYAVAVSSILVCS